MEAKRSKSTDRRQACRGLPGATAQPSAGSAPGLESPAPSRARPRWGTFLWFLLALSLGGLPLLLMYGTPGLIVTDEDGTVRLHPDREAKLAKELEEIDRSEQYALVASLEGSFPCYSCPDGSLYIFLKKGEVWKYGSTRKGEGLRYPGKMYGTPNLVYVVQFKGDYAACLREEKRKIYHYPILPEARARAVLLPRPPGNKNDN